MALTPADKTWLLQQIDAAVAKTWATKLDIDTTAKGVNQQPAGSILAYTSSEHHQILDGIDRLTAAVAGLTPPAAG